jgi:nucleotidyltransferase/DNA polymerase involved in DNA repair
MTFCNLPLPRPHIYQFVPLLMALWLDPIWMLIADNVGVGKMIEALLIACEMLARGETKRFCVLCPPCLCDQWRRDLYRKANLVFVPSRFDVYRAVSRQIHAIFADYHSSNRCRSMRHIST